MKLSRNIQTKANNDSANLHPLNSKPNKVLGATEVIKLETRLRAMFHVSMPISGNLITMNGKKLQKIMFRLVELARLHHLPGKLGPLLLAAASRDRSAMVFRVEPRWSAIVPLEPCAPKRCHRIPIGNRQIDLGSHGVGRLIFTTMH